MSDHESDPEVESEQEDEQSEEEEVQQAQPEVEEPGQTLTKDDIAGGLTQLARTADGLSHAFVKLDLVGKDITDITAIQTYEHLRYISLANNKITTLKALSSLENLITLNAENNRLTDVDLGASKFVAARIKLNADHIFLQRRSSRV